MSFRPHTSPGGDRARGRALSRRLATAIASVAVLAALSASYAAAATLFVNSGSLGAGRAAVTVCDSNGFAYTHRLDSSHRITTLTVSGIDPGCAGATLTLTLTDPAATAIGTGSAVVPAAGWVTVTITGTPLAADVTAYRVAVA